MADRVEEGERQLGNYRLLRLLGQGGFAEVYLAEHIYLKTQVAVKLLTARLAQDDIERFRSEAQTIARLVHPNIVRVLYFGVEHNAPYLVMDYAPNGTLRSLYPKGTRLPLETVVTYVRQAAEALQYAHDQRLIHRDVKPENMLLGRNNEVLLSDFGIALVTQSSQYSTHAQNVAGTISYMAPEQIQAHPRPASDQYSLGIVVYEWLSGNRPFQGSFTEIAVKHTLTQPPSLREQIPSLSPAVESVVMTALNKDPNQRFPTIRAFAQTLQEASQPGMRAFPTNIMSSPQNRTTSPSQTYTKIAPPPLTSGTSYTTHYTPITPKLGIQKPQMEFNPLALQYDPAAPSNTPLYPYGASAYSPSAASPYPPVTTPPQPQKRFGRRALIAGVAGLAIATSGFAGFMIYQQQTPGATTSPSTHGSTHKPAASPTLPTPALLTYARHKDIIWNVRWSPDGKSIVSCSMDGTAQVWSADQGLARFAPYRSNVKPAQSGDTAYSVAWSPDSTRIVAAFNDGTAQIVDATNGNHLASYTVSNNPLYAVTWSPRGTYIVFGGFDGVAWVYNVFTGNLTSLLKGHAGPIVSLAWSPDGKYIASGSADKTAKVWTYLDGQEHLDYKEHNAIIHSVAWSPDSKRVISGSGDHTARIWDPITGITEYTYNKHTGNTVSAVAWSPDGKRIVSGGNDVNTHIWNAITGDIIKKFPTDITYGVSWSPDGTRIVTGGANQIAQVWNVE